MCKCVVKRGRLGLFVLVQGWFGLYFFFFFEIGNRNFIGNSKENYKIKGDKASPTEKRWPGLSFTPRANP